MSSRTRRNLRALILQLSRDNRSPSESRRVQ